MQLIFNFKLAAKFVQKKADTVAHHCTFSIMKITKIHIQKSDAVKGDAATFILLHGAQIGDDIRSTRMKFIVVLLILFMNFVQLKGNLDHMFQEMNREMMICDLGSEKN